MCAQTLHSQTSNPRKCAQQAENRPSKTTLTAMSRTQPVMDPGFHGCAEHALSRLSTEPIEPIESESPEYYHDFHSLRPFGRRSHAAKYAMRLEWVL